MNIHTPDFRLRVFVSSTLKDLVEERKAVRQSILKLRLAPVMFESGARPHPAKELYQSYLSQSQIFIAIYWNSYGWVAPGMSISGLEDEYWLSAGMPRLIYIKNPAPDRELALTQLLDRIRSDNTSCYTYFKTARELKELVFNDLALLLTEQFEKAHPEALVFHESNPKPSSNMPVPRNPLVGREVELKTACELLMREDIALVTLTGTAGTGKSRLALQIGLELIDEFKDGVYLVRLEPIRDPDLVLSTIAETVGILENQGGQPIGEMLKNFLREKQILFIFDNFEQVLEGAPRVAELLEACPRVKAVATSRIPLHLRMERELPVPPLEVPSLETKGEFDRLSQYAAVELFIQRAQSVRPDFKVTNSNAAAVAEICYRLDGLPLAIELAAACIKMLTPHELLTRLGHRFEFLNKGVRDLPERQRTLRGAIDWSYNLLDEREKQLFRRLSIFNGGWSLQAAESVCSMEGDLVEYQVDLLESLLDNNLVIQAQEIENQSRFEMLGTIQEYAYERLVESGEEAAVYRQHAQYYLDFIEMIETRIRSAERVRWHQVLSKEFGNIRSSLDWICRTGSCIEIGQQMIIKFGILWITSGLSPEGKRWCSQILALSDEMTPTATRAGLLCIAGLNSWALGEHLPAQESVDAGLKLYEGLAEDSLGDKRTYALGLTFRGMLAYAARDLAAAKALFQKSMRLSIELKDTWLEALVLSFSGDIALYEKDRERALDLHNLSIKMARQYGDPWSLISPLMSAGQIEILDGNLDKARSIFTEVEDILQNTGDRWSLTSALNELGHIELLDGKLDRASVYFKEALSLANALWNLRILVIILTGTAAVIAERAQENRSDQLDYLGDLSLAGNLCGATENHIQMPGIFVWPDSKMLYETDIARVKSTIGAEIWEKTFAEGQSMRIEQAIRLAGQWLQEA